MSDDSKGFSLPKELTAPAVSADIAVFLLRRQENRSYRRDSGSTLQLLLIRRGIEPFRDMWALPGGFLRENEEIRLCAMREAVEETGIWPAALMPVSVYDKPGRDPRGRVISHSFAAVLSETPVGQHGGNDSAGAEWFDIALERRENGVHTLTLTRGEEKLTAELLLKETHFERSTFEILSCTDLAFDHAAIIADALFALRRTAKRPEAVLELLPEVFTLSELQRVQETITGRTDAPANFRRKIADYVQETDDYVTGAGHRPARLYTRRQNWEG